MKISVIQPDILWEDKIRNFQKIENMISELENPDIVILPEMFSTGFPLNLEKLSEPPGSETFDWMVSISERGNFGICGSYAVRERNMYFNRWLFVTPDKNIWKYDKRHIFRISDDEKLFSAGNNRLTFSFRNVRICANVCYDLRFPVWTRNRNDYDLLINSANWPESRRDVWNTLLKARAFENQCYVAGSNRAGIDGNGIKYCGNSMIISPRGEILAAADTHECSITSDISIPKLNDFRIKFPVGNDADTFTINL